MHFIFSIVENGSLLSVNLIKPNSGDEITISIMKDSDVIKQTNYTASQIENLVSCYDSGLSGNSRSAFDNLFPSDYSKIARVIGISNGLGNYFCYFQNPDFSINCFKSYVNNIKGFTFVDWEEAYRGGDNQFLYFSTDNESQAFENEFQLLYENGSIGKMVYKVGDESGDIYWFESFFLNRGRSKVIMGIKKRVNDTIAKKFPR